MFFSPPAMILVLKELEVHYSELSGINVSYLNKGIRIKINLELKRFKNNAHCKTNRKGKLNACNFNGTTFWTRSPSSFNYNHENGNSKEIESLPQTQIFKSLYLCNLMGYLDCCYFNVRCVSYIIHCLKYLTYTTLGWKVRKSGFVTKTQFLYPVTF